MPTLSDYRSRPHWSYSSINQFLNICSLQYAFERVYRVEREFTPVAAVFGRVFHQVMAYIAGLRMGGIVPGSEAKRLFSDLWHEAVKNTANLRLDKDRKAGDYDRLGIDLVSCAVANADHDERIVAVNEVFAVPLMDGDTLVSEKPIIGEIDQVAEKDGRRVLVDFKTAARRWSGAQASKSLQPTAYLYGYRFVHRSDPVFRFDVLVKNKTPVYERYYTARTADDFSRLAVLTAKIEGMVRAEHFLPSEQGFYCAGCPYAHECRSWHRKRNTSVSVAA